MKSTSHLSAAVLVALLLGACGSPIAGVTTTSETTSTTDAAGSTTTGPTVTTVPPPGAGLLACQVSDFGGIEDQPINQVAWTGMEQAAADFGVAIEFLRSNDESNYRRNIDAALEMECDLVVTTGVLMAPETAVASRDNPGGRFAILDHPVGAFDPWGSPPPLNVRGLTFQVDEAAFLAGYLAAGMTTTGIIGTFGGLDIPPVTAYMDGFRRGAMHHDVVHGTVTTVVGWDGTEGLFTADFVSREEGQAAAQELVDLGADVIFPVADRAGEGACTAAALADGTVLVIGKDWDWHGAAADCAPVLLTSVLKRYDVAVYKTIQNIVVISALGNQFLGNLENEGVGLAPFHDLANRVPDELAAELESLAGDIVAGRVAVRG